MKVFLVRKDIWEDFTYIDSHILHIYSTEDKAIECCEMVAGEEVNEFGSYVRKLASTMPYGHNLEEEYTIEEMEVE